MCVFSLEGFVLLCGRSPFKNPILPSPIVLVSWPEVFRDKLSNKLVSCCRTSAYKLEPSNSNPSSCNRTLNVWPLVCRLQWHV